MVSVEKVSMRFNVRTRKSAVINVTSLIDVMFLLVIFVLVSAKFETDGGIAVELPQGKSTDVAKVEVQVLSIKKDGELFFQKDKITYKELPERIKNMRKEFKDPVIVINADKATPYKFVAEATDIIKQSGQSKFNLKLKP